MDPNTALDPKAAPVPDYGFGVRLLGTLEDARRRVTEALAAEGFGVVTELDLGAKLKEKLGVDIGPYLILGACNPALARRALAIEPYVGLFLPCNLTLWREGKEVVVTFQSPDAMLRVYGDARLRPIAVEAEERLRCAQERLVV